MAARYLFDTNVLLYLMANDHRLGVGAQELLDAQLGRCVVSVASLWEIAIKQRDRKLVLPADPETVLDELRVPVLDIGSSHITEYKKLPDVGYADPFDLVLMAQAVTEGLTLLTTDKKLLAMSVPGLSIMNCRV